MPLVFLPDCSALLLWGDAPNLPLVASLTSAGSPGEATIVVPPSRRAQAVGTLVPLGSALRLLCSAPSSAIADLPPSVATYCLASKIAVDLVVREHVVPRVVARPAGAEARWAAALSAAEDAAHVAALARAMPPSAHAVPVTAGRAVEVWAPDALLREFLDSAVDELVRAAGDLGSQAGRFGMCVGPDDRASRFPLPWEQRWLAALRGAGARFAPIGFAERTLLGDITRWAEPALGARDRLRACFRLEVPGADRDAFVLRFLLQSPDDPSLMVAAEQVWRAKSRSLSRLGRAFRDPQETLLKALGLAARVFPPIGASLGEPTPSHIDVDAGTAWAFLNEGAAALSQAGFGVIVPGELTRAGQRRLRLRMRVGASLKTAGAVGGVVGLGLDGLLAFAWEAAIGDEPLTARELAVLARAKAPLVRYRGAWVAVDPREIADIQRRLARPGRIPMRDALRASLAGEAQIAGERVSVIVEGALAAAIDRLRSGADRAEGAPTSLRAALRPYQERGLSWLRSMASLGLGACLADDMGLGKTIQVLAFLLHRLEAAPKDRRPALIVAPTSVVGNWEREIARFAPGLEVIPHYGVDRARRAKDVPRRAGALVLTSYGLLRRDSRLLAEVDWSAVVLDEAQNIKNAASATARAARALPASHRFALTGTPVENRLAELWSILEFANPGLLGPLEAFRREYAVPIERYGNDAAAARLRRIVGPFLLRRLKSDPTIIQDLPPKNEMNVICTLTREQATLYQAVVDEEMRRIQDVDGMERRGRVLALLMFLKQICNHPAQYLGESGPLPRRSGKLARLTEMLEEALAAGDKALVFTQFREMGDRLVAHLGSLLGAEVLFLHGGTPKRARDEMVRRFQEDPRGARVFVLSVKAGGTGLNLTAASHVFHYDRWWNPAVEDQATDRAYRIGQARAVQVHKLVCAGTVEEKVAALLEKKRDLASKIVGAGEHWITELGNADLHELFALSTGAVVGEEGDDAAFIHTPAARRPARRGARSRVTPEVRP